jgi:putative endonuclease
VKTFWVYVLRCADDSFYVGVTSNLEQRIAQHHHGFFRSCYTYKRRPLLLEHSASYATADQAFAAEKRIKGWSHAKKLAFVRGDWDEVRHLAHEHVRCKQGTDASTSSA